MKLTLVESQELNPVFVRGGSCPLRLWDLVGRHAPDMLLYVARSDSRIQPNLAALPRVQKSAKWKTFPVLVEYYAQRGEVETVLGTFPDE